MKILQNIRSISLTKKDRAASLAKEEKTKNMLSIALHLCLLVAVSATSAWREMEDWYSSYCDPSKGGCIDREVQRLSLERETITKYINAFSFSLFPNMFPPGTELTEIVFPQGTGIFLSGLTQTKQNLIEKEVEIKAEHLKIRKVLKTMKDLKWHLTRISVGPTKEGTLEPKDDPERDLIFVAKLLKSDWRQKKYKTTRKFYDGMIQDFAKMLCDGYQTYLDNLEEDHPQRQEILENCESQLENLQKAHDELFPNGCPDARCQENLNFYVSEVQRKKGPEIDRRQAAEAKKNC